jgi:uncharacterized protein
VAADTVARSRVIRAVWFGVGWMAVAVGAIGVVVPGLPTTVFFIVAASCFARSSPRFERWVLDLPRIGPLVRDYRGGLGMSRRAKGFAVGSMVVFAVLGVALAVESPVVTAAIVVLVAIGAWYVLARVPTREAVLRERAGREAPPSP